MTRRGPTIKDIARAAELNPATVSLALNDSPQVSAATKLRIRRIAEKLGYIPNRLALGLRNRQTKVLGMIVPDINELYVPLIVAAAVKCAKSKGYRLQLVFSEGDVEGERQAVQMLLEEQVAGVLIIEIFSELTGKDRPGLCLLQRHKVPTTVLGPAKGFNFNRIDVAMRDYVRWFSKVIMEKEGWRQPGLVTRHFGSVERRFSLDQEAGFQDAMRELGIEDCAPLIFRSEESHELTELGRMGACEFLEHRGLDLGFIIAGNDLIAEGILIYKKDNNMPLYSNIGVGSVACVPFPPLGPCTYATARIPLAEFGEALVELTVGQIEAGERWRRRLWLYHPVRVRRLPERAFVPQEQILAEQAQASRQLVKEEFILDQAPPAGEDKEVTREYSNIG